MIIISSLSVLAPVDCWQAISFTPDDGRNIPAMGLPEGMDLNLNSQVLIYLKMSHEGSHAQCLLRAGHPFPVWNPAAVRHRSDSWLLEQSFLLGVFLPLGL